MARKTNYFHIRLDASDCERLSAEAERLKVSKSEYLRYLIRLAPEPGREYRAVTIERGQLHAMRYELVRWGRHYNQAVHALNSIEYRMEHGQLDNAGCRQLLLSCEANLAKVDAGRAEIERQLVELSESALVGA